MKESQTHQKKRINEMLVSLLKDLNEVGTIIGTSNDAMKVRCLEAVSDLLRRKLNWNSAWSFTVSVIKKIFKT